MHQDFQIGLVSPPDLPPCYWRANSTRRSCARIVRRHWFGCAHSFCAEPIGRFRSPPRAAVTHCGCLPKPLLKSWPTPRWPWTSPSRSAQPSGSGMAASASTSMAGGPSMPTRCTRRRRDRPSSIFSPGINSAPASPPPSQTPAPPTQAPAGPLSRIWPRWTDIKGIQYLLSLIGKIQISPSGERSNRRRPTCWSLVSVDPRRIGYRNISLEQGRDAPREFA